MAKTISTHDDYPSITRRLMIFAIYGIGLLIAAGLATGSYKPSGGGEWLWWMSAIALYTVSTLSAPFFIRPRDSLANALVSAPMLFIVDLSNVPSYGTELDRFRWVSLGIVVLTAMLSAIAIGLQASSTNTSGRRGVVARATYKLAVPLGNEAVMFTPPALLSIFGFYQQAPVAMLWLAAMWVLIVTVKPVQLLLQTWNVLWSSKATARAPEFVGHVTRVDDPNIIRVALSSRTSWKPDKLHKARLVGEHHVTVIPLFVQTQDDQLIGTGLCCESKSGQGISEGQVWSSGDDESMADTIKNLAGCNTPTFLAGFVVESSTIAAISFEVAHNQVLVEGSVVFVRDRDQTVYYQVLNAETKEELFTQNPRGTHVVVAGQLGIRSDTGCFQKYGWVPPMNAPVFLPGAMNAPVTEDVADVDEFTLGTVAQTGMKIKASLSDLADYHTAVLGVTGSGKTELVLDMIRAHVKGGRKVFCVDCTGEYEPRLADLKPTKLAFDSTALSTLDSLVNDAEHGEYNAANERKALHEWVAQNQDSVNTTVANFLLSDAENIGIFDLPDIANSRASLRATEMYISSIFAWAKKNRKAREIVIVLEEAHTVVPEMNAFGFDKADTTAVVARMAQIALQGRKYGVGLLLVSQRTALVSKSLLSQCNTSICFTMYDKTGLDYLSSVFASEHVRAIPNLRFLQGIAFGKAIKSERPIIFEIPNDPKKREASNALNKIVSQTVATEPAAPPGDARLPSQ